MSPRQSLLWTSRHPEDRTLGRKKQLGPFWGSLRPPSKSISWRLKKTQGRGQTETEKDTERQSKRYRETDERLRHWEVLQTSECH